MLSNQAGESTKPTTESRQHSAKRRAKRKKTVGFRGVKLSWKHEMKVEKKKEKIRFGDDERKACKRAQ